VTADLAIKHVVLLMMENDSFDHMLGSLQAGQEKTRADFDLPFLSRKNNSNDLVLPV
jgi:phospholipase C